MHSFSLSKLQHNSNSKTENLKVKQPLKELSKSMPEPQDMKISNEKQSTQATLM